MRPTGHDLSGALPAGLPVALGSATLQELLVRATQLGSNAVCFSDITLPDEPVVWVNDAFTATTGYTFEEAVGRNCRFLQDGIDPNHHDVAGPARAIGSLIDARQSGTVVILNRRANGSLFYNALSLSPLPEASGLVRYYLGVQQDVSEQVAAEQARDRSHAEAAELADQLQNRLVPAQVVASAEWDVAVRYEPATRADGSRGEVSGDFYDLRARRDGHLLAVVGDVSGRGPRAAATTAALRWSIRGLSSVIDDPALLLRQVADAVHDALDERFATVAAVRLPGFPAGSSANASTGAGAGMSANPGEGAGSGVVIALAGHPQPVLLPVQGPARLVGRPGMLLGPFALAEVEVVDEVVPVTAGEFLVLYTDGVTEAASPEHELLGDEGLLAAVNAVRGNGPVGGGLAEGGPASGGGALSADDVADAVLAAVARHVGGGPTDDLTLMVLRRR